MASKKKVPTRSIRIDMPDELRPIYDVCQAALDEILSTDSLHQTLSTLTMTKNRQTNREEIVSVVGAVWDKYKTRVPSQARYGRILFRHIENMLKSRSRGVAMYTVLKTSGGSLAQAQSTLAKMEIYATMTELRAVEKWDSPPALPKTSIFVMNMGDGDNKICPMDDQEIRFKILPGGGEVWAARTIVIPTSVREQWNGVVCKPSFTVRDGVGRGTLPYECTPDVVEKTGRIMGVDLGDLQPYTAVVLYKDGSYSQTYTPSRSLRRVNEKRRVLRQERSFLRNRVFDVKRYVESGGVGVNKERQDIRWSTLRGVESKLSRVSNAIAELSAAELIYIARQEGVEAIHLEDLRWVKGGNTDWTPGMMRDAIMSAAELAGIKVHLINPSHSSKEHPKTGERSEPDRDRVVRFSDGSEYDRDELAAINMAVRRRRKEKAKKNRRVKLRDKHTATPKQLKRKTSRRSERKALVDSIKRANDVTDFDRALLTVGARPGVAYMPRPGRKVESGYVSPWCVLDTRKSLLLGRCAPDSSQDGHVCTNLSRQ
jgi:hypothetical protein